MAFGTGDTADAKLVWGPKAIGFENHREIGMHTRGNFDQRIFMNPVDDDEDDNCRDGSPAVLFEFSRFTTSYLAQIYVPSAILVYTSIGSIFIPSNLVPGRMTLCITTSLTVRTQSLFMVQKTCSSTALNPLSRSCP